MNRYILTTYLITKTTQIFRIQVNPISHYIRLPTFYIICKSLQGINMGLLASTIVLVQLMV